MQRLLGLLLMGTALGNALSPQLVSFVGQSLKLPPAAASIAKDIIAALNDKTPEPTPAPTPQPTPAPTPDPTPALAPTSTPPPAPRERLSWLAMTDSQRGLYISAVQKAMDLGYHYHFTQLVEEPATYSEYYLTTGWAYWNRKYVLAYETMIRSLDPTFANVTVPYWDVFADYAQAQVNATCQTLDCASLLTPNVNSNSLGGYTNALGLLNIDSNMTVGFKATAAPFTHFCESNSSCSHWLPRGNWRRGYPSGFGYFTVANALNIATDFQNFTSFLKATLHNNMHVALGSTMVSNRTMADVLFVPFQCVHSTPSWRARPLTRLCTFFFSATIDMMLQIYINCYVGEFASDIEKQNTSNPYVFIATNPTPTLFTPVTQRLPVSSTQLGTFVDASNHSMLGPFFQQLPTAYWSYVSASTIGPGLSYTYVLSTLLGNLTANTNKCVAVNTWRRRLRQNQVVGTDTIQVPKLPGTPVGVDNQALATSTLTFPMLPSVLQWRNRKQAESFLLWVGNNVQKMVCKAGATMGSGDLCLRLLMYIECEWNAIVMGDDPYVPGTFSGGVGPDAQNPTVRSACTTARASREYQVHATTIQGGTTFMTTLLQQGVANNRNVELQN
ncbi:Aste57867_10198 [Aphanomyces stellatus]|uniref:Aste57867_10198 protein n=1 Tax=Aphanomyces stellatus TaxID=120398 RepID=A0A485KPS2_9STRA|nr:hypothetical protein As57867_010159 [Aphanomyces stellatus]VFT87074.1 Aste57867_10198 [Aphanomyces stellatus]